MNIKVSEGYQKQPPAMVLTAAGIQRDLRLVLACKRLAFWAACFERELLRRRLVPDFVEAGCCEVSSWMVGSVS